MDDQSDSPVIVKVGGSLFDLPDFGVRLERWLATQRSPARVLVPGGGLTANVVRALDRRHGLGDEAAHWLALQAMTLNGYFLAALLKHLRPVVNGDVSAWPGLCREGRLPILDAYTFAQADESRPTHLPHTWNATSDAVAARVAVVANARRLILLKSVTVSPGLNWDEVARQGVIDSSFAEIVAQSGLDAVVVNLRRV
jgi:aspartokinase-like uncharacterized kinase